MRWLRRRGLKLDGWAWVGLAALAFLLLFLLYPTLRLTFSSLTATDAYREFFTRPYYFRALGNSLWLSTAATLGCLALGVPLAVLVARYDLPAKGLIRMAALLSLLSPPFLGAYAWVILLGRSGVITRALGLRYYTIYGPGGVALVFILHHFAYVFLMVSAALTRVDPTLEEAAATMGATPWARLRSVTLPLVLPAMAASGLLVFTTTLADFGTPMLIGEGLRTLPVLAYNEFLSELGGNAGMATAISVIMLLVALAALWLQARVIGGRNYAQQSVRRPEIRRLPRMARLAGTAFALLVTGVSVLPQVVILVTSFIRARGPVFTGQFGLDNYRLAFDRLGQSIVNTLLYASVATAVMLLGGMLVGWLLVRRPGPLAHSLDALLVLAQVLPGTVLGIGLIAAWGRPPFSLTGTGTILVTAYVVRRIAFTVRASGAGMRQIAPAVEEASLTLGARPTRTFVRITLPMVLPAALSGALVSWLSTVSELSSTIMLYTGRTATMSVEIYHQVLSDSFGSAAALGAILTVVTVASLWALRRWSLDLEGWGT